MITAHYGRIVMVILLPITLLLLLYYGYSNSRDNTLSAHQTSPQADNGTGNNREKAAFVVLARNSDLFGLRESMRMMEDRFNRKFNYPWVFLNDEPFDEKFKEWTTGIASGETYYGSFDNEMWGYPEWIDQEKAKQTREKMEQDGIIYGGSESYRHMCR
jgi:alpha 1,2-mannosyltransferase